MAQFDVHRNPDPRTRADVPFLVDIQSNLLSELDTRVVIPLAKIKMVKKPFGRLNPTFQIQSGTLVLDTAQLAGVSRAVLGPTVANLDASRDVIIAAIDVVITGV